MISLGSCNEVNVYINMCRDLNYIAKDKAERLLKRYEVLGKQINTMIQKWV